MNNSPPGKQVDPISLLFEEKGTASGLYTIVITDVTAANLTFDGVTPSNSYPK